MKVRIKSPEISRPPGPLLCFICVISCTSHNSLRSVVLLNLQMRKQKLKKKSYVTCLGSHRIKFPHLDPKYHGRFSLLLNEQFSRIFLMISFHYRTKVPFIPFHKDEFCSHTALLPYRLSPLSVRLCLSLGFL